MFRVHARRLRCIFNMLVQIDLAPRGADGDSAVVVRLEAVEALGFLVLVFCLF